MNTENLLKWNAQGTVPPQTLLDGGYANLTTPDATHFNALMYNIFSSLKTLGDESNDSQRATNYAIEGGGVELSASSIPKFNAMTSANGEGNYSTQTITEDLYRGRVLLADSSASAFPVSFRGNVILGEGAQLSWDKADANLSVPYTASFDIMKETSDLVDVDIVPATKSQPYIVEDFKVLTKLDTGSYSRVSFTFRLRKTEGQDTSSPAIFAFLLQITPSSATGTKTTIGVSGMSVTTGSVATGFTPSAIESSVPKLATLATINVATYVGRPCSFSTTLASESTALGLPAGTYYGIHVKAPTSMTDKTYGNENAQIMTDGKQLYFRKYVNSAVGTSPFMKSPTMTDVSELLKVYAKTSEVNASIANALQSYYTKTEADTKFMDATETSSAIDTKINAYDKTLWSIVSKTGMPTHHLATNDDLSAEIKRVDSGTYFFYAPMGVNIINMPFVTTADSSSSEGFCAIVVKNANIAFGIAWGNTPLNAKSAVVSVNTVSTSTILWEQTPTTAYVNQEMKYTRNDLGNREVLVWQGSLTAKDSTAIVPKYREHQRYSGGTYKTDEPAWVHFIMDAYGGNRYTFRCPWKPNGYLTEPTGNFGINTTNIMDSPTYDTSGNITSENIYFVEMRINMVTNPSDPNQYVVTLLSNDHAPINTATKNIGKVFRDSGNFTLKGIIFEYDKPNY